MIEEADPSGTGGSLHWPALSLVPHRRGPRGSRFVQPKSLVEFGTRGRDGLWKSQRHNL